MSSFVSTASGYTLSGVVKETFVMCCVMKDGVHLAHGFYTPDFYPAEFATFGDFMDLMKNYNGCYNMKNHTYDPVDCRLMVTNLSTCYIVDKKFTLDLIPYKPRTAIVINEEIIQYMKGMDANFTKLFLDYPAHCVILGHAMKSDEYPDSADSVFAVVEKEIARICNMDYARIAEHEKFKWLPERMCSVKVLHTNWVKEMKKKFAKIEECLKNNLTREIGYLKTADLANLTNYVRNVLGDYFFDYFSCRIFYEFDVGCLVNVRTDEDDEDADDFDWNFDELAEKIAKDVMEKELFGYKKPVVAVTSEVAISTPITNAEKPIVSTINVVSQCFSIEFANMEHLALFGLYGGALNRVSFEGQQRAIEFLDKFVAIDSNLTSNVLINAFPFVSYGHNEARMFIAPYQMQNDVQQYILSVLDGAVEKRKNTFPVMKGAGGRL
jgi:hypothetical protein